MLDNVRIMHPNHVYNDDCRADNVINCAPNYNHHRRRNVHHHRRRNNVEYNAANDHD